MTHYVVWNKVWNKVWNEARGRALYATLQQVRVPVLDGMIDGRIDRDRTETVFNARRQVDEEIEETWLAQKHT